MTSAGDYDVRVRVSSDLSASDRVDVRRDTATALYPFPRGREAQGVYVDRDTSRGGITEADVEAQTPIVATHTRTHDSRETKPEGPLTAVGLSL